MNSSLDLANFQISTSSVSDRTPQIFEQDSVHLEFSEDLIRVDTQSISKPHTRARQLENFTSWLLQGNDNKEFENVSNSESMSMDVPADAAPTQETASPVEPSQSTTVEATVTDETELKFRIDNQHIGDKQQWIRQPNFDTKNYECDPADIEMTVRRLKADGRILADLHQPEFPHASRLHKKIEWPRVSNLLLSTPAILNLELRIANRRTTCNRMVVSSLSKGSGSTTVAMTLARQIAAHGQRVLLIDADLFEASLTSRLSLASKKTWIQCVSKQQTAIESVIFDSESSVAILPTKPIQRKVGWPRKMLDQLASMIDSLAWEFQSIIVDCGTVHQMINESSNLSRLGRKSLLVTGQAENNEINLAANTIFNAGVQDTLVVENFSKISDQPSTRVG